MISPTSFGPSSSSVAGIDHARIGVEVGNADALALRPVRRIGVRGRGGLGQAVALEERHARASARSSRPPPRASTRRRRRCARSTTGRTCRGPDWRGSPRSSSVIPMMPVTRWRWISSAAVSRSQRVISTRGGAELDRDVHVRLHAGEVEHRQHAQDDRLARGLRPGAAAGAGGEQVASASACSPWAGRWCPRCRAAPRGRRAPPRAGAATQPAAIAVLPERRPRRARIHGAARARQSGTLRSVGSRR